MTVTTADTEAAIWRDLDRLFDWRDVAELEPRGRAHEHPHRCRPLHPTGSYCDRCFVHEIKFRRLPSAASHRQRTGALLHAPRTRLDHSVPDHRPGSVEA
jgi:hypothetical protein